MTIKSQEIVDLYLSEKSVTPIDLVYSTELKRFLFWNKINWEEIEDNLIKKKLIDFCESKQLSYDSHSKINSAVEILKVKLLQKKSSRKEPFKYVPFSNGYLNLETNKLEPPNPELGFTYCLPFEYKPLSLSGDILEDLSNYCPNISQFFADSQENNQQKVLKLIAVANGVISGKFLKLQKFVYCLGKERTGKTTFVNLLAHCVGEENCLGFKIQYLTNHFSLSSIRNKHLIILGDEAIQRENSKAVNMLKDIVGGGDIYSERKFENGGSGKMTGTFFITANKPIFSGNDAAIRARQCLLEFNNKVPEAKRDANLGDKLASELEQFIPIVLSMPDALVEQYIRGINEGKIKDLEVTQWLVKCEEDNVGDWFENNIIVDDKSSLYVGTKNTKDACNYAYYNYLKYCENHKDSPVGLNTFVKRIETCCDYLDIVLSEKKRDSNGRCYRTGVRLRKLAGGEDVVENSPTISEYLRENQPLSGQSIRNSFPEEDASIQTENSSSPQLLDKYPETVINDSEGLRDFPEGLPNTLLNTYSSEPELVTNTL